MNDSKLKNRVIAMSNILAERSTRFSLIQQRLFYISLISTQNGLNENNEVVIARNEFNELFECLGLTKDTSRWTTLRKQLEMLRDNSKIEFSDEKGFDDGQLIIGARCCEDGVHIRFDTYYLPLINELSDRFVRLLSGDLLCLNSKFSMMLYQNLMKDKWKMSCADFMAVDYSTKQLKDMFGLTKDSYMNKLGNFNRTLFERKTINKAVEELNKKSKCIKNLKYEKVKEGNKVKYYKFTFDYTDPQKFSDGKRFIVSDKKEENNGLNSLQNDLGRLLESL